MNDVGADLRSATSGFVPHEPGARARVGYVDGAIGSAESVLAVSANFPDIEFASVGRAWPIHADAKLGALIVSIEPGEVDHAVSRFEMQSGGPPVIAVLRDADIATTRRLIRAGAADILSLPLNDAALALSLERVLARGGSPIPERSTGQVIAFLKAGGGVGATTLGAQVAITLAARSAEQSVCFVDLDLQFGLGGLYLDLADTITLTDILGGGGSLHEAPLAEAIARHRSGVRLLAAPRELTPLETLSRDDVAGLMSALRRDFTMSIVDLPSVWTAWTNRVLQLADRIVLITELSVSHVNLVKRQLTVIAAQNLTAVPLTLVCNKLSAEQQAVVSVKTAEKAIGRPFDLVIPEDRKLMNEAIAQGRELSAIRPGSKLVKAMSDFADRLAPQAVAQTDRNRKLWR